MNIEENRISVMTCIPVGLVAELLKLFEGQDVSFDQILKIVIATYILHRKQKKEE